MFLIFSKQRGGIYIRLCFLPWDANALFFVFIFMFLHVWRQKHRYLCGDVANSDSCIQH